MDLRYRSRITVPLGSTIIPSRGLKYCLQSKPNPRFDLLLHSSQNLPVSWAEGLPLNRQPHVHCPLSQHDNNLIHQPCRLHYT